MKIFNGNVLATALALSTLSINVSNANTLTQKEKMAEHPTQQVIVEKAKTLAQKQAKEYNQKEDVLKEKNIESNGVNNLSKDLNLLSNYFSLGEVKGFYSYEEYKEKRDRDDPKKEKNGLFQGAIINSEQLFNEELFVSERLKELKKSSVGEVAEDFSKEEVTLLSLYANLKTMTGFKMFDDTKDLKDTLFLFIDFNENKAETDKFFENVYKQALREDKNLIIYPLALTEDGERLAFNMIKTFFLNKPSFLLSLNERSFYSSFAYKANERMSMMIMDGVASNNLVYFLRMGFAEHTTLLKVSNGKIITSNQLLDKDKIKEFIDQK